MPDTVPLLPYLDIGSTISRQLGAGVSADELITIMSFQASQLRKHADRQAEVARRARGEG